jgi:hypothetical protein
MAVDGNTCTLADEWDFDCLSSWTLQHSKDLTRLWQTSNILIVVKYFDG